MLALFLGLALVHGLIYVGLVPPWGHYDEPTHFEYAWLIANRLTLPDRGDYDQEMRREVAASMLEHRFFRDLEISPDLSAQEEPIWLGLSELVHPPLYYVLAAFPLRILRHTDVSVQLYLARLVSLGLYLVSVWLGYRITSELVPSGHPLRWIVPGFMVLLPAFTDLMTAVNNDAGAVAVLTFFLWGTVRTVLYGVSLDRGLWLVAATALCLWTKNTAAVAILILPLALLLAWFRRPWHWLWWLAGLAAVVAMGLAVLGWGDAGAWNRATSQSTPTSQHTTAAPAGRRVIRVETTAQDVSARIYQSLPDRDLPDLRDETVTLGAWIWADQPRQARTPAIYDSRKSVGNVVQVDTTPAFYAITATLASDAGFVQVILYSPPVQDQAERAVVYYDGLILALGDRAGAPQLDDVHGSSGLWDGMPFDNLVRNGSGEVTIPRVRPWIDRALIKYARRYPSQLVTSILDWEYSGWVYPVTAQRLLHSFWARFGWNQVGVSPAWYWFLGALTMLGAAGAAAAWVKACRAGQPLPWQRAVGLLALAALLLWLNAFLRPHPVHPNPYLSVARYAYPAIVPTVLALAGGWWRLTPGRLRRWFPLALFTIMGVLDVASLWTLLTFFYGR